ncbi:MAG: heavy-metal-associated domain-containing protein [Methylococcales bacterium]|nr:heavy-metal-associated domain-containing protein [Methylococcales bacterium]
MSKLITLTVTGMKCGGCETNAKTKLDAVDGIIDVIASHKNNEIKIEFDPEKINNEVIIEVITEAGYKVMLL